MKPCGAKSKNPMTEILQNEALAEVKVHKALSTRTVSILKSRQMTTRFCISCQGAMFEFRNRFIEVVESYIFSPLER